MEIFMNDMNDLEPDVPKDPVTRPEVPDNPTPAEPEGFPDPPPAADPYPVSDPPFPPETDPIPEKEPAPSFPEPIPGTPPDAYFHGKVGS